MVRLSKDDTDDDDDGGDELDVSLRVSEVGVVVLVVVLLSFCALG